MFDTKSIDLPNVSPCYSLSFRHLPGIEPIKTVPEKREKQFLAEGLQHFANGAPLLEAVSSARDSCNP